ncbi:hypothetical protein OH77DRAFT_1384443, partial [Trametes cingulata]
RVCLIPATSQDETLRRIFEFLQTLELPEFTSTRARFRFLKRCQNYFVKDGLMYRRYPQRMPVRVVFDVEERQSILEEAHE